MDNHISWTVVLELKPGELDNFRALTREMVEETKSEPGALVYERFLSDDERTVYVHERYIDSAAAVAHLQTFGAKFGRQFAAMVERKQFMVFGSPSPELRAILDQFQPTYAAKLDGFARFA